MRIFRSSIRSGAALVVSVTLLAQQAQPPAAPPAQPPATTPATAPAGAATGALGGLNFYNVSLVEVIDILAQKLKINYILDPRVKGNVTINTYGEIKPVDVRQLLDTILRINGAVMVQVGDLYRIVPADGAARLPISPKVAGQDLPNNEDIILNLIFLKYASVNDMQKLIEPFMGEGRTLVVYEAANLLMILDNARNMRRTMELIALFDNDAFATKRVRLFQVENGSPSDIVQELETVFKAYAMSEKNTAVKFMPIDRINTIIAVAPNPGVFEEVEKWIAKLDVPVKVTAGSIESYLYRLKYGCAETVAGAVMQLYGLYTGGYGGGYGGGLAGSSSGGCSGALGGGPAGGVYGGASYGQNGQYGAYGAGMYGGGGVSPYGAVPYPPQNYPAPVARVTPTPFGAAATGPAGAAATGDLTGSYLGAGGGGSAQRSPRIVPNPFDNSILVLGTPQEWEQIKKLLEQIDVPPRQVLIEAKIYEVDLSGSFSSGVSAAFEAASTGADRNFFPSLAATVLGAAGPGGIALNAAALVGRNRRLLLYLNAQEESRRSRVIAAPSIIATDSIQASINVGTEVPTLTSQGLGVGTQAGGSSLFTNTIANRNTGITLSILARVNPSGIVTMVINQEVSAAQAPSASSAIQSPSISKKNVSTQVTVQDGDTVAIGGVIQEINLDSTSGIPGLHKLPGIGVLFGGKSISKQRTELVIFLTPRVIYDTNQVTEAGEELKGQMKKLQKMIKD